MLDPAEDPHQSQMERRTLREDKREAGARAWRACVTSTHVLSRDGQSIHLFNTWGLPRTVITPIFDMEICVEIDVLSLSQ